MAGLLPCPIWGGGQKLPTHGDYIDVENTRAGGRYQMTGTAYEIFNNGYNTELASKLTTWIVDQHRFGETIPNVTSDVINAVKNRSRLNISEQIDRLFLLLIQMKFRANSKLTVAVGISGITPSYQHDTNMISAWMECESDEERKYLLELLSGDGFLKGDGYALRLSPKGVNRLDEMRKSQKDSKQAFVAMWFDASMQEPFNNGLEKAILAAGYAPMRIDKKEHNNKIDDEIIAEIKRSRFVVADFTCGTINADGSPHAAPRGGVYFEAGFATGLGIPVIWCCRKDLMKDVHFDTRQFSHIIWETSADLKLQLYNRIAASIGETTDAPGLA